MTLDASRQLSGSRSIRAGVLALAFVIGFATCAAAMAQDSAGEAGEAVQTASVVIDGETLFHLRGVTAFPAAQRAAGVKERIVALAQDASFDVKDLTITAADDRTTIYAGDAVVMNIVDVDAAAEDLERPLLAQINRDRIAESIEEYRRARSPATLLANGLYALGVTGVLILLLWGLRRLFRWLNDWSERSVRRRVQDLASKSHELVQAGALWGLIAGLLRTLRVVVYLVLAYFYLNTVLGLFPWTRPAAKVLFQLVLNPLKSLWLGFLGALPDVAFLVVLWLVVRYILKIIRAFFNGVEMGRIKLEKFEADWAEPTFRIVRILVIAFAIVIAYPYIPGSGSAAFKGVSVFLGVLFSLGSSSFIANMIAGMAMTYRGTFKDGDLIRVGEVVGRVEGVKLMVTRLRTAKNESVILPNSTILNTEVTNYSQHAQTEGLILHSMVGIGYDAPWRQVEAMLLEAAARTEGLKTEPPPFVLQKALGDFAVQYEINGYWRGSGSLLAVYSRLHANIQDVFNEHGVQIMSPAYEGDPEAPKIVPPEKWFEAPAKR
ncbi:MAG: mechanosensitive ion channel family protein [Lysobacterales bacterium]